MLRLLCVGAVLGSLVAPNITTAQSPPDFGEGTRARQVAWHAVRVVSGNIIVIRGPRTSFCDRKPALKSSVTELPRMLVIDAFEVRSTGPEHKCRRATILQARVEFAGPMDGRKLYDGAFSPPRRRTLPLTLATPIAPPR